MYFKYGNYTHPAGEIDMVNFTKQRMFSPRNEIAFERHNLTLMGHFCTSEASGQDAIKAKIEALEDAYLGSAFSDDAVLYQDDGTISAHKLLWADAINGVRVQAFSYPKGAGGEYATGRTYQIRLTADYLNTESLIYSFRETVVNLGTGAPVWELVPNFLSQPTKRIIFDYSPKRVIQAGEAVGLTGWPDPVAGIPAAILPLWEHQNKRVREFQSPRMHGNKHNLLYPAKWRYEFSVPPSTTAWFPQEDW